MASSVIFLKRLPPKFGKGKDAFRAFRRINLFKKFASQEKDIIILQNALNV
jgi:hypothetical protein